MNSTRFPFEDFDNETDKTGDGFVPLTASQEKLQSKKDTPPGATQATNNNIQPPSPPPPSFSQEELENAKKQGFEEGKQLGLTEGKTAALSKINTAQEQLNQRTAAALESLNIQLATLFSGNEHYTPEFFLPFIRQLAISIVQKFTGNTVKEDTLHQIDEAISHCMTMVIDQPILTIHLPPDLEAPFKEKLQEIVVRNNFRGEIRVRTDSTLAEHDCRLDWQDGFMELSKDELWKNIQKVLGI